MDHSLSILKTIPRMDFKNKYLNIIMQVYRIFKVHHIFHKILNDWYYPMLDCLKTDNIIFKRFEIRPPWYNTQKKGLLHDTLLVTYLKEKF